MRLDGGFVRSIGEEGEEDGYFSYPQDVAITQSGLLVITDRENHRVQVCHNSCDLFLSIDMLLLCLFVAATINVCAQSFSLDVYRRWFVRTDFRL